MKPSVSVQVRVPTATAILLRRAARQRGMKLAAYVRFAAIEFTAQVELHPVSTNANVTDSTGAKDV